MAENDVNNQIELLVIGGSAGSFAVLMELIPKIRNTIDFPIIIVLHRKAIGASSIASIFSPRTSIPVIECEDKEELIPGRIYFAPADYHLLLERKNLIALDYSEKVNYSRPAIDITFKTAADIYQKKTAGILLSGANSDGAMGLSYIKKNNGTTIVQTPDSAEVGFMPQQALNLFTPDYVVDIQEMIVLINKFNNPLAEAQN
ncbi:MAG: chemotaxis protein CheB [Pelobium sp.]